MFFRPDALSPRCLCSPLLRGDTFPTAFQVPKPDRSRMSHPPSAVRKSGTPAEI
jgi:hypothetical protein